MEQSHRKCAIKIDDHRTCLDLEILKPKCGSNNDKQSGLSLTFKDMRQSINGNTAINKRLKNSAASFSKYIMWTKHLFQSSGLLTTFLVCLILLSGLLPTTIGETTTTAAPATAVDVTTGIIIGGTCHVKNNDFSIMLYGI